MTGKHLFIVGAFSAVLPGCITAESGTVPDQPTIAEMPASFVGKWSSSLADCDLETGDPSKWLYVGARSVGSFEHMYPLTEVRAINPQETVYSVAFESGMRLRLTGSDSLQSYRGDGPPLDLIRCPADPE